MTLTVQSEAAWLASADPQEILRLLLSMNDDLSGMFHPGDRKLRLLACATAELLENTNRHPERTAVIEACEQIADGLPSCWGNGSEGLAGARNSIDSMWGWTWAATCENVLWGLADTFIMMRGNAGGFHRQEEVAALLRDIIGNPFQSLPGSSEVEGLYICEKCDSVVNYGNVDLRGRVCLYICEKCDGVVTYGNVDLHGRYQSHTKNIRKYRTRDNWIRANGGQAGRLAEAIYHDQKWEDMPILADMLEDVGCEDEMLLRHLRGFEVCLTCGGKGAWPTVGCVTCRNTGWVPAVLSGPHVRGCWAIDCLTNRA